MADLSPMGITLSVETDNGALDVGTVVAYRCAGVSDKLLKDATDDDALAMLMASSLLPSWFPVFTVQIDADSEDVGEITDVLTDNSTVRAWSLNYAGGAGVVVSSKAGRFEGYKVSGAFATFTLTLIPQADADIEPSNAGSLTLDFSDSKNAVAGIITGVF